LPGLRFRFLVLIRSSGFDQIGRVNLYFKKNSKRHCFNKKKNKNQWVATRFLTGSPGRPGYTGSWFILFFHQPGPVPVPDRPGRGSTRRVRLVSKLCFKHWVPSWLLFDEGPLSAESRDSRGLVSFFCLVAFL